MMHKNSHPTRPVEATVTLTLFVDGDDDPAALIECQGNLDEEMALKWAIVALSTRLFGNSRRVATRGSASG